MAKGGPISSTASTCGGNPDLHLGDTSVTVSLLFGSFYQQAEVARLHGLETMKGHIVGVVANRGDQVREGTIGFARMLKAKVGAIELMGIQEREDTFVAHHNRIDCP